MSKLKARQRSSLQQCGLA